VNKANTIRLAAVPRWLGARPALVFTRVQIEPSARLPVDLVPPRRQQLVRAQVRLPSLGISTEPIDQTLLEGWGEQDAGAMAADPSVHWGPCRACQA